MMWCLMAQGPGLTKEHQLMRFSVPSEHVKSEQSLGKRQISTAITRYKCSRSIHVPSAIFLLLTMDAMLSCLGSWWPIMLLWLQWSTSGALKFILNTVLNYNTLLLCKQCIKGPSSTFLTNHRMVSLLKYIIPRISCHNIFSNPTISPVIARIHLFLSLSLIGVASSALALEATPQRSQEGKAKSWASRQWKGSSQHPMTICNAGRHGNLGG